MNGPFTDQVSRNVDAFEERLQVVVADAIAMERRKAAIMGVIIAVGAFILGVVCGMRWVP